MKKVFLYVHTHWDREWYREFEEFRLRLVEVVDDILEKLKSGELPCFYFDGQTAAIEDYLEIHPEKETQIKKFIKEKKLFIGPFYCSADSFLVSAEFLLRNLKFGMEYSKNFGCNDFIGYMSDTFGHSKAVPEILTHCNIKNAILWRGLGNLPSEFFWNNICVTYLIQGYFQDFFSLNIDYDKKAQLIEKYIDKIAGRSSDNILLPCGADHLKAPDNIQKQIKEINKRLSKYVIKLSEPFEYLNAVKNNYKEHYCGEFLDETKNFLLKGVYSSRIYQKQQNALCQWELSRIAEPLAALAVCYKVSKNRQKELDYAYKTVIKNHAHDSIYGCSTDAVHKDVERRFANTMQIANGIKERVLRDFSENSANLKLINLSNFPFSGLVETETEKTLPKKFNAQLISTRKGFPNKKLYNPNEIPVTEDFTSIKKYVIEAENLPPFTICDYIPQKSYKTHKITDNSLENDYIALKIKNGKINLTDKITNKTYENFIEITDRADIGDSYNFGALKNDKPIYAKLITSKIKTKGHLQSTLRIIYEIDIPKTSSIKTLKRAKTTIKHRLSADISVANLTKQLDFHLQWTNKSTNHILQVKFNLPKPVTKTISEDTTGLAERSFDAGYNIYDHVPAPKGIELKTNTAPMQRFVWAQNFGVITKGLNEYEIIKNSLNITILRATGLISQPKNPARGTPAGPPLACPDLQCLKENSADFRISFTDNPTELYRYAEDFYKPVKAYFGQKNYPKLFTIDNPNILIQAVKTNRQNDLILRLVNVSDKIQKLNFKCKFEKICICDAFENEITELKETIEVKPNALITLKCKNKKD